ncbi:MAG TPA: DUF6443 domain-containing protein [Chitinophagaceae bacterium]|jgi:RHS repeat-associated protein|nr:DUF6443 domain-containing protein [Chitinophagaceae bacterium]
MNAINLIGVIKKSLHLFISLLLIIVMSLLPMRSHAQGNNMSNPIVMGTYGEGTYSYSDSRNNSSYGNDYGQPSPDIFYRFTVQGNTQISISTCSSAFDTYLHLLDGSGGLITFDDDNGPVCSGLTASISIPNGSITSLAAGTYYIVAEGYSTYTGIINLTVNLTVQPSTPTVYDTRNFIRTWEATAPETDQNNLITKPLSDVKQSTTYFDGLGRPEQSVIKKGSLSSAGNSDIVKPFEYDNFGREVKKYLPYAAGSSDGLYKDNAFVDQNSFYTGTNSPISGQGENNFYAQTNYEPSPLNRVEKQMAPGINWVGMGKGVRYEYMSNDQYETSVKIWKINSAPGSLPYVDGIYGPAQLYRNTTFDENNNFTFDYIDKEGKTVLKSVYNTTEWLLTFYVYDDLGNLRCVIPPKAIPAIWSNWVMTQQVMDELCFRYEYDQRNRMIIKKVPGAGEVWMVYDARDRLVLTQDANMRSQNKWMYSQYDELNRPTSTGLWNNTQDRVYHQGQAYYSTTYPELSGQTYDELTHTFYNDYTWLNQYSTGLSANYNNSYDVYFQTPSNTWPYPQANAPSSRLKGLVTGTRMKVLGTFGTTIYLYTVNFYDDKARLIQVQSSNYAGRIDISTTQYNWAGQPLVTINKTEIAGAHPQTSIVVTQFTYDDLGRLTKTEKKLSNTLVNGNSMSSYKTIAQNEYDALGQLKKKILSPTGSVGGGPLETLNYDYNIRGWLLGANRDYAKDANNNNWFGFDLGYDKANNGIIGNQAYNYPQYNGNIEGMVWKSKGDGEKRKYDFTYDAANRLTDANFKQYTNGSFNNDAGINFSVNNLSYDMNGNILSMNQQGLKITGPSAIDQLSYTYQANSNKLAKVTDAVSDLDTKLGDFHDGNNGTSDDYGYGANGNLLYDRNKKIDWINYNYLNLPEGITIRDKSDVTNAIIYKYDAAGNKIQKEVYVGGVPPGKVTLYIAGAVYENDVLQFISHEEGRIRLENNQFYYDYFIKDHLGNIRMVLTDEQRTDAYPAATMESNSATTEEAIYSNLNTTRIDKPSGYPYDPYLDPNYKVAKVRGDGNKIGPAIVLKVMAGDKFNLRVSSWYRLNGASIQPPNPLNELANALANSVAGVSGGKATAAELNNNGLSTNAANSFLYNQTYTTSKPKAYVSWILLDEQFKIAKDANGNIIANGYSGFDQVGDDQQFKTHSFTDKPINKSGYLYIYVSNETPNIDVFFDNLQVTHIRGPLVDETHYYPFGLVMSGISSKALNFGEPPNHKKFNGKEEQRQEFSDGSGLEWLDYGARMYDNQIGRWHVVDKYSERYYGLTPYNYGGNCPVNIIELDGNLFIFANGFMLHQWEAGQQDPYVKRHNHDDDGMERNPLYKPYNPDRHFYRDGPKNNGETFSYWDGVDRAYEKAYNDKNAYYTNGSFTPRATASARFKEGEKAGEELIEKLESGEITLKEGETIKIVGHSQGAAYAAGIATALAKVSKYGSRVEFVDYLSPHQPEGFTHPSNVRGRQFSTQSDRVASRGGVLGWLITVLNIAGRSELDQIKGTSDITIRKHHTGGRGGHSVDTWLDDLIKYWRDLGITVTVHN